ncbi:MAG: ABC transporter permease [Pirellulales bacterium]|nr:ABC transporter permease [Pirellulales bacterium]
MRIADYIEQSFFNLWKKKLRTFLTTFGVVIGIGALVSMISFGKGMQKNVKDQFEKAALFNYVTIISNSEGEHLAHSPRHRRVEPESNRPGRVLDDDFIHEITQLEGVELAFPERRFPANLKLGEKEQFALVQVLPTDVCRSKLMQLVVGKPYMSDNENAVIISDSLLRRLNIKDPKSAIGRKIEVATLILDLKNFLKPGGIISILAGKSLPFSEESYTFTIAGVCERAGFHGPMPLRSDVFIPPGTADQMKKLSSTSIWDFFQSKGETKGYSMLNVRVSSLKYIDSVKAYAEDQGLRTFALVDQLEEMKTAFLVMDMFLLAVGMIAIVVASLGIINTMVMSILERYKEIGIMKAVGATNRDVKKIFFFESGVIGFAGGVFGLILGWIVSILINRVVNHILSKQGAPHVDCFAFPWWLCLGAILFSIVVSLIAGIYPTLRAARVDPIVALRHD